MLLNTSYIDISSLFPMCHGCLLARVMVRSAQKVCVDNVSLQLISWLTWRSRPDIICMLCCCPRMIPARRVRLVPSRLTFRCACSFPFVVDGEAFHMDDGIRLRGWYSAGIMNLAVSLSFSHAIIYSVSLLVNIICPTYLWLLHHLGGSSIMSPWSWHVVLQMPCCIWLE